MPSTLETHVGYTREEWGRPYYKSVIDYLKNSKIKTFIDLGSCTGEVSIILSENIDTIERGFLFEPIKENFEFISERLEGFKNLEVSNFAIYYGTKEINLCQMSEDTNVGGWTLLEDAEINPNKVECKVLESYPICDFIKIDVEGAEKNIIPNSKNLKEFKYISLELHGDLQNDYADFIKTYLPNHRIELSENEQLFLVKNGI